MRVLQVGFGQIGREIALSYMVPLAERGHEFFITDLYKPVPEGFEWDDQPVDIAVIVVNTPAAAAHGSGDGFDYSDLLTAVRTYLAHAKFILIRSTVGPHFFETALYRAHAERIGLAPEFYGATKWSRRAVLDMGFSIFTGNTPRWFREATAGGTDIIIGTPREVALAKLAENAYLATKVTFFHELQIAAERMGIDGEVVRSIVTADPRIGPSHSFLEEPGWQSHCFDKDVPAYARAVDSYVVQSAVIANQRLLAMRNTGDESA